MSESERRGTMNKIIRILCKVRIFCPVCGKELPMYVGSQEQTSGTAYTYRPIDVCPHCGTKIIATTACNWYTFPVRMER